MCKETRLDRSEMAKAASTVRKPGCTGTCARCPLNAGAVARALEALATPELLSPEPSSGTIRH